MGALRLICLIGGLSAAVAFAPDLARAQADAASGGLGSLELTSDAIVVDGALDLSVTDPPAALSLLETPLPEIGGLLDGVEIGSEISPLAPATSLRPQPRDTWAVPVARWDDHPNGPRWTAAVLAALRGPGAPLLDVVPHDIHAWCPGYETASPEQRAAFWTGLISTLAWHESTHQPRAVGGGGQWFGLVQIAPGTARWRDCDVGTGEALLNGAANLRCGIRIMANTVPRDGVVAEGMRGVAADWGPFHSERKREDMRAWVRGQPYCAAPPPQMRPVMRPVGLGETAARRGGVERGRPARDASPRPEPRPTALPEQRGG